MPEQLTSETHPSQSPHLPRLSTWQQVCLSIYWFSTQALWCAILIFLLPLQAKMLGGAEHKGQMLGNLVLAGALVSLLVAPVFGALSDHVRTRWGRRTPFLIIGTLLCALSLLLMAHLQATRLSLIPCAVVFMLIELTSNIATAPYSALIPDVVPREQRGSASGWMGLMSMLGTLFGASFGLLIGGHPGRIIIGYLILAVLMLLGMLVTVLTVREPEPPALTPFRIGPFLHGLITPFASRDFLWVFLTRMLVVLGTFTVQESVLFYMTDVVAHGTANYAYCFFHLRLASSAADATAIFLFALLLGAVLSSLVAGLLSDRFGRKLMVYISGALQSLVVLVFVFSGHFTIAVFIGLIFGLGYGAYQSVDWALASDVLPNEEDYAKDMGVWHVASTLPQMMAVPIAGQLLDYFQHVGQAHHAPTLGYTVIFLLSFVYFVLGTVLIRQVKGAR